jgi:Arc/MetJ-type ribon-helix-helix transcriptional regulator
MSVIQVSLPDELQDLIGRQVAEGRAASEAEFLLEAARRYAEELDLEDEMVAEAEAGIADAGRYVTISTPEDAEAWHEQKMARLQDRLATDQV